MRRLAFLLLLASAGAVAEPLYLGGEQELLVIDLRGGLPAAGGSRLQFVVPGDAEATEALNALEYEAIVQEDDGRTTAVLSSKSPFAGRLLVLRYAYDSASRLLGLRLALPAGARLQLEGGSDLVPEEFPGFGGFYSDARAVRVGDDRQETLTEEDEPAIENLPLPAGEWIGVRGRFRTLLLRSTSELVVDAAEPAADLPVITIRQSDEKETELMLEFLGGPVARERLAAAAPELTGMQYAALWTPLRHLAFALQWLLDRWQDLVGRAWLAILLLSLTVKLAMAPLIVVAERWQAEVNRIRSRLEPELAAIRRAYKGEEAHKRTLAVYRDQGVSHFYTLKSLAGFLIQVPIFIAAFDMLGENVRLDGEGFLWIADLAAPDRAAALPFALPFFGGDLNLLPFLMTAMTVAAARLQEDPSLAAELRHGQRLRLYAMAGIFFILLYTFPAGMVLYWTANNFWHLLRVLWDRRAAGRAAR